MKICAVQTRPVKGNIQANINNHKKLIDLALSYSAGIIIFPELSLTGYEPELAKELAIAKEDSRLNDFQAISNTKQVIIGVGIPTKKDTGTCISMIIFQPHKTREVYSKNYLHADEEPFFVPGENFTGLQVNGASIALAICYELSVPVHSENAFKTGATIYIASVAKTADGVEKAGKSLAGIARKYSMTVVMSNCVGPCDNFESGGKTSAWNHEGVLLGQLDDTHEGIIIIDTDTQTVMEKTI